jgi:ribosome-associated protein
VLFLSQIMKTVNDLKERLFENEFEFITSRSAGPGGQHVNMTNSKVELRFNVNTSILLDDEEKQLLFKNLHSKINPSGIIQIVTQQYRSQIKNKEKCIEKFYLLIEMGLKVPKKRIKTKPSRASVIKRLEEKNKKSEKKSFRKKEF